jgi:hypothetical protein
VFKNNAEKAKQLTIYLLRNVQLNEGTGRAQNSVDKMQMAAAKATAMYSNLKIFIAIT